MMRIVALIPARAGSKRIPGKNTKLLGGKPLIQWTIEAAQQSGLFGDSDIWVCTDDPVADDIACALGVTTVWRPEASDAQPDIEWARAVLLAYRRYDAFAILRPTSPFRTADTIRRAVEQFKESKCSSIRAVERVKQHPGKMWERDTVGELKPLISDNHWDYSTDIGGGKKIPWHSRPTQSLPTVYVQNSSLEIAWHWCVEIFGTISGPKVGPFFTEGYEGFSIDYPEDWERAERHVADLQAAAPAQFPPDPLRAVEGGAGL